jgi:hypothetical protein
VAATRLVFALTLVSALGRAPRLRNARSTATNFFRTLASRLMNMDAVFA